MKKKKWDVSEREFVKAKSGNEYMYQIAYCDGKNYNFIPDDKGYYVIVIAVNKPMRGDENERYIVDTKWCDYQLVVPCARRCESKYNLALELSKGIINDLIVAIEYDREYLNTHKNKSTRDNESLKARYNRANEGYKQYKEKNGSKNVISKNTDTLSPTIKSVPIKEKKGITFDDVAGMHDVKEKLLDVIDQFNNPERYRYFDIKPIRAILLHGVPGTGKTYIANAFSNMIDAEFKKISLGEIGSKYQNQTANNIRKIFVEARESDERVVLFFDEIDSIASKRGSDDNSKEKNATLNTLLAEMSSDENENIFIICATNFYGLLDDAFKRRGRIDATIEIPLPDFETRKGILELNMKRKPISDDVNVEKIARNMSGMNCADVDVLVNESARLALKRGKECIEQIDFEDAFEEMICGKASETKKLDDKTKLTVATHESGHLIMNELLHMNKSKKVSILPRGSALGFLLHTNEEEDDVLLNTEKDLVKRIMVSLGGRASEEVILNKVTTGASNDLEKATYLVRAMITKYGFSKELGLVVIDDNDAFMREKINVIVKTKLNEIYEETKNIISEHKDLLIKIRDELLEKEELNGEEIEEIINSYNKVNN